jgi:hypothetical protein
MYDRIDPRIYLERASHEESDSKTKLELYEVLSIKKHSQFSVPPVGFCPTGGTAGELRELKGKILGIEM